MRYLAQILITLVMLAGSTYSTAQCDGPVPMLCDADGDRDVDSNDIAAIGGAKGTPSSGPGDLRDVDGDGMITVLDARKCITYCDHAECIDFVWESFNKPELLPGVAFNYLTIGSTGRIVTDIPELGYVFTTVEFLGKETADYVPQYAVNFIPNPNTYSLLEWFGQTVDLTGSIISGGDYTLATLPNGVDVLTVGFIPLEHLDELGPVPEMYAISPSRDWIIVLQTQQGNNLEGLGISTSEQLANYIAILKSMVFQ